MTFDNSFHNIWGKKKKFLKQKYKEYGENVKQKKVKRILNKFPYGPIVKIENSRNEPLGNGDSK